MAQFTYFEHGRSIASARSETARLAAEAIIDRLPAGNLTNARELLDLPVGGSIDITDEPLRSVRREF